MIFRSDSQRRAMFANMSNFSKKAPTVDYDAMAEDYIEWHKKKYGKEPEFARRPSKKMIEDIFESTMEPVTDFRQVVPDQGTERVDVVIRGEPGLSSVRERRRDVVSSVESFPEHGYKFFTPETSGSLEEAKEQAKSVSDVISGGNARGWVDPIWVGSELVGYTVRLRNIDTGEDLLDTDTTVYDDKT